VANSPTVVRKLRGLIFALVVSVPTFAFVSVADASTPGAACKKAGLTRGPISNQLICKKVGKNFKWVRLGRVPGPLSIPLTAYSLGRNTANQPVGIQLNWYYPMDFGSSLVSGYRFEVQSASTPWLFVSNLSASTYSANVKDDNLAGKSLRFRIAAFNSVGVGVFSETNWIEYPALSSSGGSASTLPPAVNSGVSTTTTVAATTTTTTTTTPSQSGTVSQRNAVSKAASYLRSSAFSRSGLIGQLEYEGFSTSDATYGVDAQNADWNAQAVKKGSSYLRTSSFSRTSLIGQLEYEGFSNSQSVYGTDSQNADWNAQAAKKAASYLKSSSFSRSGLISQLLYEGFTQAQAEYGVGTTGL
jgi:hypothetical protein